MSDSEASSEAEESARRFLRGEADASGAAVASSGLDVYSSRGVLGKGVRRRKKKVVADYSIDEREDAEFGATAYLRKMEEEERLAKEAEGLDGLENLEPEEFMKKVLTKLATWEDPAFSSLCLSLVMLLYGLVHFSEYSIVTLVAFMALFQLGLTSFIANFAPVLREAKLVGRNFTPERFVEERRLFKPEEIDRFSAGLSVLAGQTIDFFNYLVMDEDNQQVLGYFVLSCAIFSVLGFMMELHQFATFLGVAFFVAPQIYKANRGIFQGFVFAVWERMDLVAGKRRRFGSLSSDSDVDERRVMRHEDLSEEESDSDADDDDDDENLDTVDDDEINAGLFDD